MQRNAAVLVAAILVSACAAPAHMTSNKATSYTKQPKRVYVMTNVGDEWGNDYYNAFKGKIAEILRQCGVESELSRISSVELDEKVHTKRARAFKADAVLSIRRSGGTKNQYGTIIDVNYDSRLYDVDTGKVVWRSTAARFIRGLTPVADRGEELAVDITNTMKADGIFPSCPKVASKY